MNLPVSAAHAGFWAATAMIAAIVLSSTIGEVLTAAAMKSIGDLDDIRAHSGMKGAIRAVVTCPLFFAGVGFLALFGVSVQTAIVYISYVNELRRDGVSMTEAIREGAILRLRPIMMTALVAALGLLPAAIATGVGTDTQKPFALVIVSGLFTRLLISVFLMPALYVLVARPNDRLEV